MIIVDYLEIQTNPDRSVTVRDLLSRSGAALEFSAEEWGDGNIERLTPIINSWKETVRAYEDARSRDLPTTS